MKQVKWWTVWLCMRCGGTDKVVSPSVRCVMCGKSARTQPQTKPRTAEATQNKIDFWSCPDCGGRNLPSADVCDFMRCALCRRTITEIEEQGKSEELGDGLYDLFVLLNLPADSTLH
jgi:hypothetical protein